MKPKTLAVVYATAFALAMGAFAAPPSGSLMAAETKTAKERLSDKASDDQRVDNCGVPIERRGPTPRPDCATKATPSLPAAGQEGRIGTASTEPGQ